MMDDTRARSAQSITIKKQNPLLKFTLQGQAELLASMAVAQKPLLGSFCLMGQGTVLCAPPNAGKTLITIAMLIEAIEEERIAGDDVFYVDADDTTEGVAQKVQLLDEYGVHVVAEGYRGFNANMLVGALEQMIKDESAKGKFLILDTFKKFTSLMNKADTSTFTAMVRRFVLAGGSLLCLSHTNKHKDAQGRNVFAGVSDIIDDLDCAYVMDVQPIQNGKRIVQLTNKKRRGNNPDAIAYAYSDAPEISYIERLTSVHEADAQAGGDDDALDQETADEDILFSLSLGIHHGPDRGKMELVRMIADVNKVSKRRVLRLLDAHTGDDPEVHRWRYLVRGHGKFAYALNGPLPAPPA